MSEPVQHARSPHWTPQLTQELSERFGERFTTAVAARLQHGRAECFHPDMPPDGVVFATSTADVVAAVQAAARAQAPVIAFGAGSSLEGHVLAARGGLVIDLTQMNQILEVNQQDLDCRVQAGVTRIQLNQHLRDTGLFFPVDPGADATLGGMTSTRASGTNAVRYGTMRTNVLGLTVVLADGRVIHTGGRARKSSAGYDLTGLFVGSEGTLGIITEVRLRLYGQPEAISAGVCPFTDLPGAVNAVIQAIQIGMPVARIELLDALQMKAVNRYSRTKYPEQPTLFLEFHGSEAGVAEQSALFGDIAALNGGGEFIWARATEERSRLWEARHKAYFAALALAPGKTSLTTDVCVPISRLADCICEARRIIDESGLVGPIVGHVGDGNFHVILLFDAGSPQEMERAKGVSADLVRLAIASGGTCTGEHGVGLGKKGYLLEEQGEAVAVMRAVKRALDPQNIMNPDKILDL
jgi:D-lactate dehydrogenase (cytochrome)